MWSASYVTCVDIIAQVSLPQWSIYLFLNVRTLKLRIIIIILPIQFYRLPVQQKIKLPSLNVENEVSDWHNDTIIVIFVIIDIDIVIIINLLQFGS